MSPPRVPLVRQSGAWSKAHEAQLRARYGVAPTRLWKLPFRSASLVCSEGLRVRRVPERLYRPELDGPRLRRQFEEWGRSSTSPGARLFLDALHRAEQVDRLPKDLTDVVLGIHANALDALSPPASEETLRACARRLAIYVETAGLGVPEILHDLYRLIPMAFAYGHHLANVHANRRMRFFDLDFINDHLNSGGSIESKIPLLRVLEDFHRRNHAQEGPTALDQWSRSAWTYWKQQLAFEPKQAFRELLTLEDPDGLSALAKAMAQQATDAKLKRRLTQFSEKKLGSRLHGAREFLRCIEREIPYLAKERCRTLEEFAARLVTRLEDQPERWARGFRDTLRARNAPSDLGPSFQGMQDGWQICRALEQRKETSDFFRTLSATLQAVPELRTLDPWEIESSIFLYLGHRWAQEGGTQSALDYSATLASEANILENAATEIRHTWQRLAALRPASWEQIIEVIAPPERENPSANRYLRALWRKRPNAFARVFERDLFEHLLSEGDTVELEHYLAPLSRVPGLARALHERFESVRKEQSDRLRDSGLAQLSEPMLDALARQIVAFYSLYPTEETGILIGSDGTDQIEVYGLRHGLFHAVDLFARNPFETAGLRDRMKERGLLPIAASHSQILAGPQSSRTDISGIQSDGLPEIIASVSEGNAHVHLASGQWLPEHPLSRKIAELWRRK